MPLDTKTSSQPTDFTSQEENVSLGSSSPEAVSIVKRGFVVTIDDSMAPGTQIFRIDLDTTLTDEVAELAQYYEEFEIEELTIEMQSTSPLGITSGASQIAHIADPLNAELGTDLAKNLTKMVRQSGSLIARPRDTKLLRADTNYSCFTKLSSNPRFSSFGAILGVVRDKPATGDTVTWNLTLHCTIRFKRPTIVDDTVTFTDQLMLTMTKHTNDKIFFMLPDIPAKGDVLVKPKEKITLQFERHNKYDGSVNTVLKHLNSFNLRPTPAVNIYELPFSQFCIKGFSKPKFVAATKFPARVKYAVI